MNEMDRELAEELVEDFENEPEYTFNFDGEGEGVPELVLEDRVAQSRQAAAVPLARCERHRGEPGRRGPRHHSATRHRSSEQVEVGSRRRRQRRCHMAVRGIGTIAVTVAGLGCSLYDRESTLVRLFVCHACRRVSTS